MRIAFAGTPEPALPSLDALASAHEIALVITRPDAPSGRGRTLSASPIAQRAESLGLTVVKPQRLSDIADTITELQLDAVAVVAYGGLVPQSLLATPKHGWINLHFSLLPAWRGAAPVQWSIMSGDDITGATTFRIEEGLDTGPVLGTLTRRIAPDDTAGSLLEALAHDGAHLLVQTLTNITQLIAMPQPSEGISIAPKLSKDDAGIRWHDPAMAIERRIRACTPELGAWTVVAGQRLVIAPVELRPDVLGLASGAMRVDGRSVLVGTATHAVQLSRVKPAGKGWMDADAWARGLREEVSFTDAH